MLGLVLGLLDLDPTASDDFSRYALMICVSWVDFKTFIGDGHGFCKVLFGLVRAVVVAS